MWNTDAAGTGAGTFGSSTATTDTLNIGNGAAGLGAGTINVGTVSAGNMTFASGSGAVVLSGGTITLAAAATITTNNTTDTIGSAIAGAGTSLTTNGSGTLVLGGANTYSGSTLVNAGTLSMTGSYAGPTGGSKFVVNGGTLNFNLGAGTANFYGDGYGSSMAIGDAGYGGTPTGTVTLQSGTLNIKTISSSAASVRLGLLSASANGTLIVNGGTLNVPGRILMAANSASTTAGTVTVNGGALNMGTVGSGSYTDPGSGVLWFGAGTSTVNLNGGTLALYSLYDPTAGSNVTVNLNGGTLKAIANNTTFSNVTSGTFTARVQAGGAVIDTSTYNITIPAALLLDPVSTGGGLTKKGSGILTVSGANTFAGNTLVTAGTLALAKNLALQNSAIDTSGAGAITVTGFTAPTFGGLVDGAGQHALATVVTTGYSAVTGISLNPAAGVTDSYSGVIANGAAGMTLAKTGAGTQILSGANTYSGATTVSEGTLTLGFGAVSSNILSSASSLAIGAGTLKLTGSGTQAVNGFTTSSVRSGSILLAGTGETLNLGTFTAGNALAAMNFNTVAGGANATSSTIGSDIVTVAGWTAGSAISQNFTVTDAGGFGLASVNGSNQVVRLTSTTLLPASGASSATNYLVNNNTTTGGTGDGGNALTLTSESVNSITVDTTTANGVLTLGSGVTLNSNAFNFGGSSHTYQITGGTGIKIASGPGTININNYNTGAVTLATPILDNGGTAVDILGPGTTILTGANTFSGLVRIADGTLQIAGSGSINGGVGGSLTLAGFSTFQFSSSTGATLSAAIAGSGGITKDTSTSDLNLTGTNTYTGPTTVSAGRSVANTAARAVRQRPVLPLRCRHSHQSHQPQRHRLHRARRQPKQPRRSLAPQWQHLVGTHHADGQLPDRTVRQCDQYHQRPDHRWLRHRLLRVSRCRQH